MWDTRKILTPELFLRLGEKKKHATSRRRRICVCVARSDGATTKSTSPDYDKYGYWCSIWLHVSQIARDEFLTKRMLLSMLEKVLFIIFIRFHLFMWRFRREFASTIKKKKKYTQCRNERLHERFQQINSPYVLIVNMLRSMDRFIFRIINVFRDTTSLLQFTRNAILTATLFDYSDISWIMITENGLYLRER